METGSEKGSSRGGGLFRKLLRTSIWRAWAPRLVPYVATPNFELNEVLTMKY